MRVPKRLKRFKVRRPKSELIREAEIIGEKYQEHLDKNTKRKTARKLQRNFYKAVRLARRVLKFLIKTEKAKLRA
jgi:hypothetical protein